MDWWVVISGVVWGFVGYKIGRNQNTRYKWTCMAEGCKTSFSSSHKFALDEIVNNHLETFHPQGY